MENFTIKELNGNHVSLNQVTDTINNAFIKYVQNSTSTDLVDFICSVNDVNQEYGYDEFKKILHCLNYKDLLLKMLIEKNKELTVNSVENDVADLWFGNKMVATVTF